MLLQERSYSDQSTIPIYKVPNSDSWTHTEWRKMQAKSALKRWCPLLRLFQMTYLSGQKPRRQSVIHETISEVMGWWYSPLWRSRNVKDSCKYLEPRGM